VLGDDALAPPWEEFAMETPYMRDDLVSRLRAVPEGGQIETAATGAVPQDKATAPRAFCTSCGNPLGEGLAFCNKCGKPVGKARPSKASCTACGNTLGEGLAFCNKCGKPV
jgi:hypothetical protein